MPFRSVQDEMHKFKEKKLHSGSPSGPVVKSRAQALAISLSEQRKADAAKKKRTRKKATK